MATRVIHIFAIVTSVDARIVTSQCLDDCSGLAISNGTREYGLFCGSYVEADSIGLAKTTETYEDCLKTCDQTGGCAVVKSIEAEDGISGLCTLFKETNVVSGGHPGWAVFTVEE
ncbi:unnamed protein product [Cercospora beticola]|nr:unnamed protein product [Cercospora beticola]